MVFSGSFSNRGVIAMHKLVDPLFQSKTDFEIFTLLAAKFGQGKDWTRQAAFREDPEINVLVTPSGFIEIFSRKIDRYEYKECQGHPMWFEKAERSHGGPGSKEHPIWLQSCHPNVRLHSQMCDATEYRETYAVQNREPIYINAKDAKQRDIKDGDLVRVFNTRRQLLAGALISDNFPTGVARIEEGAWYAPIDEKLGSLDTYGDPNTLTMDIASSELAQATSANTCQVQYENLQVKPLMSLHLQGLRSSANACTTHQQSFLR